MPQIYLLVSQHFDLIWRRPISRYRRIRKEVISSFLDLLKEFPELKVLFVQGWELRDYFEDCPERKEEFKKFIFQGRIEITTGGESLIDLNLVSGESIVRNLYYARKYFREEFNFTPVSACLADAFGACAQIPQILKLSGIKSVTGIRFVGTKGKLQYGNYGAFFWKGLDGSKVFAFQNAVGELSKKWLDPFYGWGILEGYDKKYQKFLKRQIPDCTRDQISSALRYLKNMKGKYIPLKVSGEEHLPRGEIIQTLLEESKKINLRLQFSTQSEYTKKVWGLKDIPTLSGEHNPEFTGCYSTRIELKRLNRGLESRLQSVETLYTLLNFIKGRESKDLFRGDWIKLALLQFHYAIAGCHVDENYHFIQKEAHRLEGSIQAKLPSPSKNSTSVFFNPLPWERIEFLRDKKTLGLLKLPALGFASLTQGDSLPLLPQRYELTFSSNSWQATDLKLNHILFIGSSAPPVILLREDKGTLWEEEYTGKETKEESSFLVSEEVNSLFTRLLFRGRITSSSWDNFENLSYEKEILVLKDRILFRITLDFQGKDTEIVLFFPLRVNFRFWEAIHSVPFGELTRRDYAPEVHSFTRLSIERAVFGERAKDYGIHAKGNWPVLYYVTLRDKKIGYTLANRGTPGTRVTQDGIYVSVLRSPTSWSLPAFPVKPSPLSQNNGTHCFEFCLFTHPPQEIPRREAISFSFPPLPVVGSFDLGKSFLEISPSNILFSSLKPCENLRSFILRLYETSGKATICRVKFSLPIKSVFRVNLNEENPEPVNLSHLRFRPFEIVSLKIEY